MKALCTQQPKQVATENGCKRRGQLQSKLLLRQPDVISNQGWLETSHESIPVQLRQHTLEAGQTPLSRPSKQTCTVERNCRLCDDQSTYLLSNTTNLTKHRQLHHTSKTPYAQRVKPGVRLASQVAVPLEIAEASCCRQQEQRCNSTDNVQVICS